MIERRNMEAEKPLDEMVPVWLERPRCPICRMCMVMSGTPVSPQIECLRCGYRESVKPEP
jgi:hypothetical protein